SPRVLTQDHKPAVISASTIVPFVTGESFNINGQPILNFDYREVGLQLNITPHINQTDYVKMDLDETLQEIAAFLTEGSGANSFQIPEVNKREITTQVTVADGQTIVIGGLVQKQTTLAITRVPLLSDLPLVGNLFKQKNREDKKTTLV